MNIESETSLCDPFKEKTCKLKKKDRFRAMKWWKREEKNEFLPTVGKGQIEEWMQKNNFLGKPIYYAESHLSRVAKGVEFIRRDYRETFHIRMGAANFVRLVAAIALTVRFLNGRV